MRSQKVNEKGVRRTMWLPNHLDVKSEKIMIIRLYFPKGKIENEAKT